MNSAASIPPTSTARKAEKAESSRKKAQKEAPEGEDCQYFLLLGLLGTFRMFRG
jgi:hypothetical protein